MNIVWEVTVRNIGVRLPPFEKLFGKKEDAEAWVTKLFVRAEDEPSLYRFRFAQEHSFWQGFGPLKQISILERRVN